MSIVDKVVGGSTNKPPSDITDRLDRGRKRMQTTAAKRNECMQFWRGEQYVYVNSDKYLSEQSVITNPDGTGKPRHRVRTKRNVLVDVVAHEVSAATQRVPSYEVTPSSSDPEDIAAARIGEKVALYGYDKWDIRRVTERVVTYAVVADEGFAWPYFDNTIGPFMQDEEGQMLGQGEIRIRVFGPNEVFWEPGISFEESRWCAIEQARDINEVMEQEGYQGGKLSPDAQASEHTLSNGGKGAQEARLVMVTEYLERPSPKRPLGRWITIANKRQILPERPYPCTDANGSVLDEHVLCKLSYFTDPDSDRDSGLVKHLLDAQRTINDCTNKQLEWKNLALAPQIVVENGEFREKITDEPGAVYHYRGAGTVRWREVPPIPGELSQLKEEAKRDMAQIAAQNEIPSQVESGRGIQVLIERDSARRQAFIARLADFHSTLMRHCLYLVQKHYTEDRLLKIKGRFGWEHIPDFQGSDLRGQADVRVAPGSIEPRTKAAVEQRIMTFAQAGWISPEAAMAAINGGTAEKLVESYELDVARANMMIQKIKEGPEILFSGEMRIEPDGREVPSWMPRPFDNLQVHKSVFEDWMKTNDYDTLPQPMQVAAETYYQGLLQLEADKAAADAQAQQMQAESLGMANAAKPQLPPPMPDQAGLEGPGGGGSTPPPPIAG